VVSPVEVLSLCSGVGWLDEGVAAACRYFGVESRVLGYCERDAYAAAALLARMDDASLASAPIWCGNLQDMDCGGFGARPEFRERGLVVAGFPCQPWSSAGKQDGVDDLRWLWPAIEAILAQVQAPLVFLENVPGLVSGRGVNHVLDGLALRGLDAEWLDLKARDVGANHLRRRVFILAYRPSLGRPQAESPAQAGRSDSQRRRRRVADCVGTRLEERAGQRSDARPERTAAERDRRDVGHAEHGTARDGEAGSEGAATSDGGGRLQRSPDAGGVLADAEHAARGPERGNESRERPDFGADREPMSRGLSEELFAPGPSDFDGWNRTVADGSFDWLAPAVEPGLRVLVDGCAFVVDATRTDQLRGAGNGVVALQAAVAFVELVRRAGLERWLRGV